VSPRAGTPGSPAPGFDLDRPWRLDDRVAVRPEPFGALLYHFGTRRLSFLADTTLLAVLRAMDQHPTARSACMTAGIGDARCWPISERWARWPVADDRPAGHAVTAAADRSRPVARLAERFERGLTSPIHLTWELTYVCNLACAHGSQVHHRAAAERPRPRMRPRSRAGRTAAGRPAAAPRPADDHSHRGPVRRQAVSRTGRCRSSSGPARPPASLPSPAAPLARACDANPLAGFGSDAGKDQHYVLDEAHIQRKG